MRRTGGPVPFVALIAVLVVANLTVNLWLTHATPLIGPVFATACLAIARWDGCTWDDLGLGHGSLWRGLKWAGLGVLGLAVVYAVAIAWGPTRHLFADTRANLPDRTLVYEALVRVPLGTVLLEEVAFRGTVLAMGVRRWGVARGIGFSSLLFGLWHVLAARGVRSSNPVIAEHFGAGQSAGLGWTLAAVGSTALAGVVLCLIRLRTRSLFTTIGLHWATNALAYLGAGVARAVATSRV